MNKVIWKYPIRPNRLIVDMPKGATVLCAREQMDEICVWAEVDPNAPTEKRHFEIYGTGHPIFYDMGTDRKYIGTARLEGGALVLHVYEYVGV